jgi:hypothetical protein
MVRAKRSKKARAVAVPYIRQRRGGFEEVNKGQMPCLSAETGWQMFARN